MSLQNESYAWYCLNSVKGLGPKRLHVVRELLEARGLSAVDLLHLPPAETSELLDGHVPDSIPDGLQQLDWDALEADYHVLQEAGISVLHLGHADYPPILHERLADAAPAVLFCLGYLRLLRSESFAIVGARSATSEGLQIASQLAHALALEGKNVISGFAKGVDTEAHLGALRADGTTTIVLSSGILDFAKKRSGEDVDWERSTLAISQFHPREHWSARNAMIRNKLVCALAKAVIVIEAGAERDPEGKMSGTFQTGRTALELGVPLFVVSPGCLTASPPGNTALIQLGATEFDPVTGLESILLQSQQAPRSQQPTLF
jgi:DNA processing protein